MTTGAIILVIGMVVFMGFGAPIYLAILLTSFVTMSVSGLDLSTIIQRCYAANDNFTLLAIPFFFMAGELMLQGGIAKKLVTSCKVLFGRMVGCMMAISFFAAAFFGAISGSSYATIATIGKLMYPEMVKDGYEPDFAATVQAVGGILGTLIPPSILCVLYGVATGTSVGDMLLYILPVGIVTTLVLIIAGLFMIRSKRMGVYTPENGHGKVYFSLREGGKILLDSVWALLTPAIILGGIYTGIFTPTECAVIATLYAWVVGTFVYKELNWKTTFKALADSIVGSACVILIFDAANVFSWLLTINRVGATIARFVESTVTSPIVFLLLVNIVYLILGMFVEGSVTIVVITPLLFPIARTFGINPIHFGLITVFNCILGTLTPPFGGSLFVTSTTTGLPVTGILRRIVPFLLVCAGLCLVISYVPLIWLM